MNITFDPQADALYIQFQKGAVAKTIKERDGLLIDIDDKGRIFGIEILDATYRLTQKGIEGVNINFPIKLPAK